MDVNVYADVKGVNEVANDYQELWSSDIQDTYMVIIILQFCLTFCKDLV